MLTRKSPKTISSVTVVYTDDKDVKANEAKPILDYYIFTIGIDWFHDAKLKITENYINRRLADKGNEPAII